MYEIRKNKEGKPCIMSKKFNVVIAEFAAGTETDQQNIAEMLGGQAKTLVMPKIVEVIKQAKIEENEYWYNEMFRRLRLNYIEYKIHETEFKDRIKELKQS